MARGRWLTLVAALAAAGVVRAAGPCEEDRGQTGLALEAGADGLTLTAVDPDSAGARAGMRVGDAVVQVNGTVPRSCGEYARTVRDARRERKALLVLVRRAEAEVPLALAARTWEQPVAVAEAARAAEAPSVRAVVAAPPPPPLPAETHVTLDEVTHGLAGLVPPERPPARLDAYRRDLLQLRRETETLAARQAVPAGVVSGLRTVLRYYEAGAVAWNADEALRERARLPRHVPTSEAAAAPYFADSEAATAIDEFPFLRAAVVRDPSPGPIAGESAGLWRPLEARALLWQHGREEFDRLTAWLAAGR